MRARAGKKGLDRICSCSSTQPLPEMCLKAGRTLEEIVQPLPRLDQSPIKGCHWLNLMRNQLAGAVIIQFLGTSLEDREKDKKRFEEVEGLENGVCAGE